MRARGGSHTIRTVLIIAGLLGLAFAIYLIADSGAATVAQAMLVIGWGLIPITLFHVVPLGFSTLSWREMLPPGGRPSTLRLLWARWVRESINALLPVGQVGGDLVCVRLSYKMGVPGPYAAGTMVVDLTVGVMTQMVFLALGLVLLLLQSTDPAVLAVVWAVLIGMGVFIAAIGAFFWLQHAGLFTIFVRIGNSLMKGDGLQKIAGKADAIDDAVRQIYRSGPAFWRSLGWRLLGWISGAGEIWLTLYFLGQPISLGEAIILESLGQAVKAAAFLIPGALGVLEGSFIVFGALFGIGADASLAMALAKRVRELALGLPGLISWQIAEGKSLFGRRAP